ncbi:MAG: hypothetical protein ACRENJ_12395 [Candidatus Eiseniibacteriota bacterium]
MRRFVLLLPLAAWLVIGPTPAAAVCPAGFLEHWDEAACCGLPDAEFINIQVPLPVGPGAFVRDPLADFDPEPLLPVSNGGDLELFWTNGFADAGDLALTPDHYNSCRVRMETVVAANGDLVAAEPRAGVVVRYEGGQGFYSAYAAVGNEGGSLKVRLHVEKYVGGAFGPLDAGPPPSVAFDFAANQNFRVGIEVGEPDADGNSTLTGYLDRLSVVGGVLQTESLVVMTGVDDDFHGGQIGLYVQAGSLRTQVAFDESIAIAPAPTAVRGSSWGALKTIYR